MNRRFHPTVDGWHIPLSSRANRKSTSVHFLMWTRVGNGKSLQAADKVRYGRRMAGSCSIATAIPPWRLRYNPEHPSSSERPKLCFKGNIVLWDVSRDGKRFLMVKQPASAEAVSEEDVPRKIVVVANWFEELKQRVPTK